MPWGRFGDTAATHPIVMRGAFVTRADGRTLHELLGFYLRLAALSAAHTTDYVVEMGTVAMVGGAHTKRLLAQAVEAGYLTEIVLPSGQPAWRLVSDPEFVHLRTRVEVEWDRRRKADNGQTEVTLLVVLRDGSVCRYCGRTVSWTDRVGARGATYDHLTPGLPVTAPEHLVVACRGCNSSRGQAHAQKRLAEWDLEHPLRPPPPEPYYCAHVLARLSKAGFETSGDIPSAARPDIQSDPAPARPDRKSDPARRPDGETNRPGSDLAKAAEVNSPGRAGQGQARSGRSGAGGGGPGSGRASSSRRRRGRRGRGGSS